MALALAAAQPIGVSTDAAWADGASEGEWTAPLDIGVIGIHSTLMPNGKALIFQRPGGGSLGSVAKVFDPSTGDLADVSFQTERDVFCSDHNVLPDGRVFVAGGHIHGTSASGVAETDLFDPATNLWSAGPTMTEPRWYPTNLELGDGSTLIFGGQASRKVFSDTVDRYDPVANTITPLSDSASYLFGLYPHVTLLPDGRILWASGTNASSEAEVLDPTSLTWSDAGDFQVPRLNVPNTVLMPGLATVMVIGGGGIATNSVEVLDTSQPGASWQLTTPMNHARRNANAVLLADGSLMEVGGGAVGHYTDPERTPEIFDPTTSTWTDMAPQAAARMYHSSALLLPDGRVLSVGQDKQNGPFRSTAEIFSPPYLFRGDRPTIDAAPTATIYGDAFTVQSASAAQITRVALVHPGSVSHSNDSNQRYVDLSFTLAEDGSLTVAAPADGNTAPPGWYMLFLVDSSGIPSVASWIHVDTTIPQGGTPATTPFSTDAFDRTAASGGTRASLPGADAILPSGPQRRSGRGALARAFSFRCRIRPSR